MTMARALTADVRLLDLPQVRRFSASVTALLGALGGCDGLPEPVTAAVERLWQDVAALSPDEDRIRGAMAGAQARRVITR